MSVTDAVAGGGGDFLLCMLFLELPRLLLVLEPPEDRSTPPGAWADEVEPAAAAPPPPPRLIRQVLIVSPFDLAGEDAVASFGVELAVEHDCIFSVPAPVLAVTVTCQYAV